jgi:uncharacterized cupredoxin-like copper-binding protein
MHLIPSAPLLLLATGTLAGCAGERESQAAAAPNLVTISAKEFGYQVPDSIPAGLTTLQLTNTGQQLHHMQLVRLDQEKTAAQFVEAMKAEGPPPAWAELVGGPNAVEPGSTVSSEQTLKPGHYAILCLIPGPDGVPHFMKGMYRDLQVKESGGRSAPEPKADVDMKLVDYGFELSSPIKAGRQTIRVLNGAAQPHEVVLVRVLPGKKLADIGEWEKSGFKTAPPVQFLGGVVGLAPGRHAYFSSDFKAGSYGLLCFFPDAKDGKPHLMHGMMSEFEVS